MSSRTILQGEWERTSKSTLNFSKQELLGYIIMTEIDSEKKKKKEQTPFALLIIIPFVRTLLIRFYYYECKQHLTFSSVRPYGCICLTELSKKSSYNGYVNWFCSCCNSCIFFIHFTSQLITALPLLPPLLHLTQPLHHPQDLLILTGPDKAAFPGLWRVKNWSQKGQWMLGK